MRIRSKVWLTEMDKLVFGSGKAEILRAVAKTGSLNGAAGQLGMSYRHVWSSIRAVEQRLGKPLLIKSKGGRNGGGAILTDYAKDLLEKFERIDEEVKAFADRRFKDIFDLRKRKR